MRYALLIILILCCPACTATQRKNLTPNWQAATSQVVESRQVWHESTGHTLNAPTSALY